MLTLTEVVASDIRRPPVNQGTQGIDRPDGLRGILTSPTLLVRVQDSPYENTEAELKAKLRTEAIATRREASARYGAVAAQAISNRGVELTNSLPLGFRATIGGYHPIRDEIDPLPLLHALHERGASIALPVIRPGPALVFRNWLPGAALVRGKFGLSHPHKAEAQAIPNVIFVPLLGFSRQGCRLGYGGGYYDAALRALRKTSPVVAIGAAFDEQEFEAIPHDTHDELLDFVLTPSSVIRCGG